eukprot:TRINITY_DN5137_c0_g1_i5.p1 TRINITY_DN5137_c0_g1~~TRINITY_DN5137_c0_g1_i5.p1  ORF type:complete len:113 (+),score=35.21 TRINITY_DN5137_c0_g1_i5:162-500(+)
MCIRDRSSSDNATLDPGLFFSHASIMMFSAFSVGFLAGTPPLRAKFAAPRVVLSAHILGCTRAILLFALGAAWPSIRLDVGQQLLAARLLISSFWTDFLLHLVAGLWQLTKS